jgi:hypothetical protein
MREWCPRQSVMHCSGSVGSAPWLRCPGSCTSSGPQHGGRLIRSIRRSEPGFSLARVKRSLGTTQPPSRARTVATQARLAGRVAARFAENGLRGRSDARRGVLRASRDRFTAAPAAELGLHRIFAFSASKALVRHSSEQKKNRCDTNGSRGALQVRQPQVSISACLRAANWRAPSLRARAAEERDETPSFSGTALLPLQVPLPQFGRHPSRRPGVDARHDVRHAPIVGPRLPLAPGHRGWQ